MKNINIKKRINILIVAAVAIVLIGTLLWVFLGGGFGTDFTGGNSLAVIYDDSITSDEYNELKNEITALLKKAHLKTDNIQELSFSDEIMGIQFTFPSKIKNSKTDETADNALAAMLIDGGSSLTSAQQTILKDYLGSDFNFAEMKSVKTIADDVSDISATANFYQVQPSKSGFKLIGWTSLGAGVGLIAAAVYCAFRFYLFGAEKNAFLNGLRSALTLIINAFITLVLAFMLSIIFAVIFSAPIQSNFGAALLIAIFYSIISTMYMLNNMKRLRDGETEDLTNATVSEALLPAGIFAGIIIVALIVLGFTGTVFTGAFAASAAAGILAATFSSVFLLPFVWNKLRFEAKKEKVKQAKAGTEITE